MIFTGIPKMRNILILLSTVSVAACSGGGPTTIGGNAVPAAVPGTTTPTTVATPHTFVAPTDPKSYATIGGVQGYNYSTDLQALGGSNQYGQIYAGDASSARNSGTTITYNPRDAIFDLAIDQQAGNVKKTTRFQDPADRTDFGGAKEPQTGTPDLTAMAVKYLENSQAVGVYGEGGFSRENNTFFYQPPGTKTKYVTFSGYDRNTLTIAEIKTSSRVYLRWDYKSERGAFVYGERSANAAIPTKGTGSFNGDMIATMVFNPNLDIDPTTPTYFQWIAGTATTKVDFAANSFKIDLGGTVLVPQISDRYTDGRYTLQAGATFAAAGAGRIDLINAGGFLGSINSASFVQPNGTRFDLAIAGSSVDGAFFGPAAEEVGGGFRIVGGTPDERIDIVGAFTGKQP
jgi:C-lobe and N-lobe beta barrels of Tf-binding protein B